MDTILHLNPKKYKESLLNVVVDGDEQSRHEMARWHKVKSLFHLGNAALLGADVILADAAPEKIVAGLVSLVAYDRFSANRSKADLLLHKPKQGACIALLTAKKIREARNDTHEENRHLMPKTTREKMINIQRDNIRVIGKAEAMIRNYKEQGELKV